MVYDLSTLRAGNISYLHFLCKNLSYSQVFYIACAFDFLSNHM